MSDSQPLTPEQIDLLLSADLDGEFDAAASDLGLESAAARAALASEPTVDARRADLAAARDLLGEPIEIDELLAARLRTKAVKAGSEAVAAARRDQRTRRGRMYGIGGGIAAALLLVVALGASLSTSLSTGDSGDMAATADRASESGTTVRSPVAWNEAGEDPGRGTADEAGRLPLADAYATVEDLATDVRERQTAFDAAAPAKLRQEPAATPTTRTVIPTGSTAGLAAYKCGPEVKTVQPKAAEPVAVGTTEIGGEPQSVYLYRGDTGRTLYVFDSDCKLVNRQLIP